MNWISVKDRLPKMGKNVLTIEKSGYDGSPVLGVMARAEGDEGWAWAKVYSYIDLYDADAELDDNYQPTHWMPLPEPPVPKISEIVVHFCTQEDMHKFPEIIDEEDGQID